MAEAVLDASALLAYMHGEAGADEVEAALQRGCAVGIVHIAEVLSKLAEAGDEPARTLLRLESLGDALEIVGLDLEDAVAIARLRPVTKAAGLSLADRACLALARRLRLPAMTCDRDWNQVDVDVEIVLIRD
jgi:PIN domain nuclease of toxin-antitoxin system